MKYYRMNELDFILPDGWRDGSTHAFVPPPSNRLPEAALVINRDMALPDVDVQEYADRHMIEAAKRFTKYQLIHRRSIHVDGQPAVDMAYAWQAPKNIKVHQRQVILKLGGLFMNFTLTVRENDAAQIEEIWSNVIESIRLRDL